MKESLLKPNPLGEGAGSIVGMRRLRDGIVTQELYFLLDWIFKRSKMLGLVTNTVRENP